MIGPILSSLDLLVQILFGDSSERESTRQHHVQKHTESPHIDWLSIVLMFSHDLRTHVAWGSAENL